MRVQRNYFDTVAEAEQAQRECVCAHCGGSLKWHYSVSRKLVTCVKNPNHRHLRPKPAPTPHGLIE
jgi:hypothetical protein